MSWISDEEKKFMQEFQENRERVLLGIEPIPERKHNLHKNKKWAWIKVNGERKMVWIDNQTMVAYEADGYDYTDTVIPEYKFERWCRPMDI